MEEKISTSAVKRIRISTDADLGQYKDTENVVYEAFGEKWAYIEKIDARFYFEQYWSSPRLPLFAPKSKSHGT
eukprot:Awhi_evm1s5067